MTEDGDIRNNWYATRSKEYVWSTLAKVFPRGITPTDFDYVIEQSSCFMVFEAKTQGTKISKGQGMCFRRAINSLPFGRSVFVVGEHPQLDVVKMHADLISVRYAWREAEQSQPNEQLKWSPTLHGPDVMKAVATIFVHDAHHLGHLEPEKWEARLAGTTEPEPQQNLFDQ